MGVAVLVLLRAVRPAVEPGPAEPVLDGGGTAVSWVRRCWDWFWHTDETNLQLIVRVGAPWLRWVVDRRLSVALTLVMAGLVVVHWYWWAGLLLIACGFAIAARS